MKTKMVIIYLYSRYERFWHWLQSAIIITLLITGFELHGTFSLIGFRSAVDIHNFVGLSWLILFAFFVFWLFTTGEYKQYIPTTRKMLSYQELSRELDAIIASSDDGLWICDGQGTILRINRASERLNRLRASDVVGRNINELVEEGHIDDSVTLKVMKTRQRENILQQTRSGRKLILTGNPVFNPEGELIRVVDNQ